MSQSDVEVRMSQPVIENMSPPVIIDRMSQNGEGMLQPLANHSQSESQSSHQSPCTDSSQSSSQQQHPSATTTTSKASTTTEVGIQTLSSSSLQEEDSVGVVGRCKKRPARAASRSRHRNGASQTDCHRRRRDQLVSQQAAELTQLRDQLTQQLVKNCEQNCDVLRTATTGDKIECIRKGICRCVQIIVHC